MDIVSALRSLLPPLLLVLAACSDPAGSDAPSDHTLVIDGVAHAPGAASARVACTECHGADLRGGDDGEPSCFRCHGTVWVEPSPPRP